MAGHAQTLRVLIMQGNADFHERNTLNGWVPLHEVCMRGFLDCVKILLSFQASMHPRTIDGDTPRDLAIRYGHTEVEEFLGETQICKLEWQDVFPDLPTFFMFYL